MSSEQQLENFTTRKFVSHYWGKYINKSIFIYLTSVIFSHLKFQGYSQA